MDALVERINAMPVCRYFGAQATVTHDGVAVVTIDEIRDFHAGGFESRAINGMILMGLLDLAMCTASLARLESRKCATVDLAVKFLKPVLGKSIVAYGDVVARSNDLLFCEASIQDARGRRRVIATGIVRAI
jgi:uncharacterized protein (TIGR00369 family)